MIITKKSNKNGLFLHKPSREHKMSCNVMFHWYDIRYITLNFEVRFGPTFRYLGKDLDKLPIHWKSTSQFYFEQSTNNLCHFEPMDIFYTPLAPCCKMVIWRFCAFIKIKKILQFGLKNLRRHLIFCKTKFVAVTVISDQCPLWLSQIGCREPFAFNAPRIHHF